MVPWPERVNITDEGIQRLQVLLKATYKQIVSEINGATDFGVAQRRSILTQIDSHLTDLGVNVQDFIAEEIPDYYKSGASDAIAQLDDMGAEIGVKTGFSRVQKQAIASLVSDTTSSFADAISGVKRSATRLLGTAVKQQITQDIASGMAKGDALKSVVKTIKGTLADEGLDSLVDKSGRTWSLDAYSEMLYRTKMAEARNLGMVNRMAENGYDLVQVSAHGAIDVCGKWEGQILSTTGATKEYLGESVSTVDQATNDGLFHPNCKHAINAIVPDLAAEAYGYSSKDQSGDNTYTKGEINKRGKTAFVKQKVSNIVQAAQDYNAEFGDKVTNIANALNAEYKIGNAKSEARAFEKVVNDYNLDASQLKDANRSVLLIDDPTQIDTILSSVKDEFDITRVKDQFNTTDSDNRYKRILINVTTPAGTGEIQITTPEYWTAKKQLGGDKLYDQVRVKEGDWEAAMEKMNSLYDEAQAALDKRLNSS